MTGYRTVQDEAALAAPLEPAEPGASPPTRKQVIFAAGDVVSCLPVCYSELVPGISPTDNTDEGYDMRHTADHQPEAGHVVRRRRRSTARTGRDGAQNGRLGILFTKSGFRVDRTGAEPEDETDAGGSLRHAVRHRL